MAAFRVKCPTCGETTNIFVNQPCPKCGTMLSVQNQGEIQIYRMGSPIGIAAGFGIYINGMPMGHIGNKEMLRIPLPYGTYNIHIASGMNRRCKDAVVVLSPEHPVAYTKCSIRMGAWTSSFNVVVVGPQDMPRQ